MWARPGRRSLIISGAFATAALIVVSSYGPLVRSAVAREAAKRHVDVTVGRVRPAWFAVRLLDLDVREAPPSEASEVRAHVDELRVELSALLRVVGMRVRGAQVMLTGTPEEIREDLRKMRGDRPEGAERRASGMAIDASNISLRWVDPSAPDRNAELHGIAMARDGAGVRLVVADGKLRLGRGGIDLRAGMAQTDADGMLVRARASALTVGWMANGDSTMAAVGSAPAPAGPTLTPPVVVARAARPGRRARTPPPPPEDAGAPIVPLPDLRSIRASAGALAALLAQRIQLGADIGVDSLTWKVTQASDRVALTFGPGPLSFNRTPAQLELGYSTDRHGVSTPTDRHGASTPLALRVSLPLDRADLVITVDGGPVSLSLLGVNEGAAGLADVDRATVAGRVRIVLAGDATALTFEGDIGMRAMSLDHPKLAPQPVRGLDVSLRGKGAITAAGAVRIDDFAATLGALRVTGSGVLDQQPDHVSAAARFEIPSAGCQSLLDSVPAALLPELHEATIGGTFSARGRFAFDTRALDDLELSYDTKDQCRIRDVPAALDHDRFTRPFVHRIYLPDGSTADETTGPGTENWTPLDQISPYMQIAVLTTEDGAFPKHHGYNRAAIRASIIANIKARRFVRGASTITMQLAKNLFLSRDKTLSRKLEEVVLTDYLEQTFSKDEIMELYLNVIEFGPSVYGITSAAEYYFGRTPAELDLAECLFLSTLLPAPLRYATMREGERPSEGWLRTLRTLMEVERKRGLITDAELAEGQSEDVVFWHGGPRPPPRAAVPARTSALGTDDSE